MGAGTQVVRFAKVGDREVAWTAVGSGPPLVIGGWWCRSIELDWLNERFRRLAETVAEHVTLIRYDLPGVGLSPRDSGPLLTSFEDELATLSAVVDEAGERVSLWGTSSGSCVAMAYAALHPDRVERLAIYGGYANGADIASPGARESLVGIVTKHWGVGSRLLADLFLPDCTAREREEFARFQRNRMTSEQAARALSAIYEYDVRSYLPDIKVPTLVVHRREDRAIPFALGRDVASRIPGAAFVALDGNDHMPWRGDWESVAHAILRFLGSNIRPSKSTVDVSGLSSRETDVLRLVAQGLSDQEIAGELVLSVHTVHRHVANIRTKLGLPSRTAAAAHAVRAGLI